MSSTTVTQAKPKRATLPSEDIEDIEVPVKETAEVPAGETEGLRDRKSTPFGLLLRQLRQEREISQAALARLVEISPGYVGLIETGERGERPSIDIVKRFAQSLRLDIGDTERLLRAAGHLAEHETLIQTRRPTFAAFVGRDNRLTRNQKDILVQLYESWIGKTSVA